MERPAGEGVLSCEVVGTRRGGIGSVKTGFGLYIHNSDGHMCFVLARTRRPFRVRDRPLGCFRCRVSISEKPGPSRVPLAWLARLWLVGIAILLAVDWMSSSFRLGWLTRIYFWVTLIMSFSCLVAYGIDKRRANLEKRRISERKLHLMEALGGWPGAVLGQQMFRHKTIKMSFRLVLWAIIVLHVSLSGYFVFDAIMKKRSRDQVEETVGTACMPIPVSRTPGHSPLPNRRCG